ncbi:MAG: hypothetical protein J0L92_04745 [Deltaproteobacteria bacterium]|nr:hypothetical protein [Deltaproteobacteria bacterium]
MRVRLTTLAFAALAISPLACDGGGLAEGWRETPPGTGPQLVWDLYAEDLPLIPMPNDVATWPDPTSPTGLRINASVAVPTHLESHTRSLFDELDGWGTFAPISVSFEEDLDLAELLRRQGGPDHFHESDFPEHAIYLVDLETGLPVPLDLNSGNFPYVTTRPDQYFDHDPRGGESNILFETVEEDVNRNGVLDLGEDTDFDGVLDHPNTIDGTLTGDPLDTVDRMAWFYERETKTLILRPLLPLTPRHHYAVVLTDRLVGVGGQPIRSPFDFVHHVRQTRDLAPLADHLAAHPELYGSLASEGWEGVAFAWSFTTQSVTDDIDTVREGLYGRGSMSYLASEIPLDVVPLPMQGGRGCGDPGARVFVAPGDQFREAVRSLGALAFGLDENAVEQLDQSYASLSHVVTVLLETPYFFGDPDDEQLEDSFQMDWVTGEARRTRETITMTIYVPNESAELQQPFDPVVYVHGHGSNAAEVLIYGGMILQHGQALVTINAHGHGLELSPALRSVVRATLAGECLEGTGDAIAMGRARDLDGDETVDSGADFWTAYVFHTRDAVRQTVIDQLNVFRVLRSFDGTRRAGQRTLIGPDGAELTFDGDFDRNGSADLAGDFDGNGRPDLGGPSARYAMAGGSLGGIIAAVTHGSEPMISASVPVVGGGGLSDVAIRTENGSVRSAMILRLMGPLLTTTRSEGPSERTSCAAGDYSLEVQGPLLDDDVRTEIACIDSDLLGADDVMIVRNLSNREVACAGATNHEPGRFRVGIASDQGDRWTVEVYRNALGLVDFRDCTFEGASPAPDDTIDTWEVSAGRSGEGVCERCASWGVTQFAAGDLLTAPTSGFGRRRQSPELRRLVMLAQIGLERGDPINYVGRIFLDPITAPDVPVEPRSILVTHTDGDPNVCIATGYSMARAAGVLPFLPPDAPAHLADYRAPASFQATHPGFESPNDLLLGYHAIEGLARLERHPVAGGGERFLVDIDDLSDGRSFFDPNGEDTLPEDMGGLAPVRPDTPLRWSRQSRPMTSPTDLAVWQYTAGQPTSGLVSPYVEPQGIHGFSAIYDPNSPFDMAVYMFNMIGRYLTTHGEDIPHLSDPTGHHCLEDSSCEYIRR